MVAALVSAACPAAAPSRVRTVKLKTYYLLRVDYSNSQTDPASECNAAFTEQASLNAKLEFRPLALKLASGASAVAGGTPLASYGSFKLGGTGSPANDCGHAPVPINCSGTIAGASSGTGPGVERPTMTAIVAGGAVHIEATFGAPALVETEKAGTCPDSAIFAGGGPTAYFGLGDYLNQWLQADASTTLAKLATLKKKGIDGLRLQVHPQQGQSVDVGNCNGAADGATIMRCSGKISGLAGTIVVGLA